MDTVPTVRELRKAGNKVRVIHWRRIGVVYEDLWFIPIVTRTSYELHKEKLGEYIEPKGGFTEVWIINGDKTFFGRADCSLKDTYCKRTGRELAIKRALGA